MLITPRHFEGTGRRLRLEDGALARRDFWESKEEARTSLSTKGMKTWDKRVVELFVVSKTTPDFCFPPVSPLTHFGAFTGVWPSGDNQG